MIRRVPGAVLMALALSWSGPTAVAGTLEGVAMPDQVSVGGKSLELNGLGLRTATFLKVKVYVIGLYLETKSGDSDAIIDSAETKRIEMQFVRDVDAKEIRDGWSEGFAHNYPSSSALQKEIASFNDGMRDMKSGGRIVLDLVGNDVDVMVDGKKTASVAGREFQKAVLSIWLGRHPPNEALKKGLLGG